VLVYVDRPAGYPAQVTLLDDEGRTLSDYSAFELFATT
jgi:negative regulator of sigma E activity